MLEEYRRIWMSRWRKSIRKVDEKVVGKYKKGG